MNEEFENQGIVVLKQFLTEYEVQNFRELAEKELVNLPEKKYFAYDELSFSNIILERIIIDKRLSLTLKSIFNDVIILPDFVLQYNNTPKKLLKPHYDCQSFIHQGMSKALSNLKNAKIGLYFQKSDKNNPGAIWYVPGSHKNKFNQFVIDLDIHKFIKSHLDLQYKKFMKSKLIPLECNSGDLVIFDGRLLHTSSPQNLNSDQMKMKKMSVYFSVAGTMADATSFMRAEFLKLADEIVSNNINDIQRIGSFFSKISKNLKSYCLTQGIKSYELDGKVIREFKFNH